MLKLKEGYILRRIGGENVVIPSGDELNLNVMITLNDTGSVLWKLLEKGTDEKEMVQALLDGYQVDEQRASASVRRFTDGIREKGLLA